MPLPVSAQSYLPNTAVALEARRVGFETGRQTNTFANVVSGVFSGAQSYANIQQTRASTAQTRARTEQIEQETEAFPAQEERKDRALDLQAQEVQVKRERNQLNAEVQKGRLEADRLRAQAYQNNVNSQIANRSINAAIKQKEEAKKNRFDQIMGSAIVNGNMQPLVSALRAGEGGELAKSVANEAAGRGSALLAAIKDAKRGRLDEEDARALDNFANGVGKMAKLLKATEGLEGKGGGVDGAVGLIKLKTGYGPSLDTQRLELDYKNRDTASPVLMMKAKLKNGKEEEYPIAMTDLKDEKELLQAINNYNQNRDIIDRTLSEMAAEVAEVRSRAKRPTEEPDELPTKETLPKKRQITSKITQDSLRARLRERNLSPINVTTEPETVTGDVAPME